jgi:hypothetical protein
MARSRTGAVVVGCGVHTGPGGGYDAVPTSDETTLRGMQKVSEHRRTAT